MTPELFSDRGIAWAKAVFDVSKLVIEDFGLLALAYIAVWQNIKVRKQDAELQIVKDRLDRQSTKIETNAQAITAVALATPTAVQNVNVVNPPEDPVQTTEAQ